jgi:hypothetical protein
LPGGILPRKGRTSFRVTGGGVAEQVLHPTGAAILVSRGSLSLGAAAAAERVVRRFLWSESMADFFAKRVGEDRVAAVLQLIAAKPRWRDSAAEGDLPGDFDYWFDGGACKQHTDSEDYLFADGTRAFVAAPATWLWVSIAFPNGEVVNIVQDRDSAPDRPSPPQSTVAARPGTANLYSRPEKWFCIFCGWKCDESFNDYICKRCRQLRPFVGGSATICQCQKCEGLSLAVAHYCEWCGASFGVDGTAEQAAAPDRPRD